MDLSFFFNPLLHSSSQQIHDQFLCRFSSFTLGMELGGKKLSCVAFLLEKFIYFPIYFPCPTSHISPPCHPPLSGRFSMCQGSSPNQYHHSPVISKLQLPPVKKPKCHQCYNLSLVRLLYRLWCMQVLSLQLDCKPFRTSTESVSLVFKPNALPGG